MITELPREFSEIISKNNNLKQYLLNLQQGKPYTDRSWLYEHEDADKVLNRWLDRLGTLADGTPYEKEVFQFDISQKEKWGPQGGVKPIDDLLDEVVLPSFARAGSSRPEAYTTETWNYAKEAVDTVFRRASIRCIRPASYAHVVDDMRARDTLESNSGWPDFAKRNLPDVKHAAEVAAANGQWRDYPAIALFRNYRQKTRLVWMFPMATNVYEGSYYQPLQSNIVNKKLPFFAPWIGFEAVQRMITDAYGKGLFIAASDFHATDEHFVPSSSFETFDVLKNCLQRSAVSGLRNSISRMHKIPLIIGVDRMITGSHGVSSGSNWTNFIETVFDYIFSKFAFRCTGMQYRGFYAIGDDMAWTSATYNEKFNERLEAAGELVGQEIKADKTTNYPDKVKTLQRLFQRGYSRPDGLLRGVYSTVRALNSSIYPERYHKPKDWSSDMFCCRQYMILENCVDHPLFEEFVKFVVKGQKDLIPFAHKGRGELDQILRKSKLLPGLNPTYNQEKKDQSLADFASIAVAAKM